jgi:hypothetical protein
VICLSSASLLVRLEHGTSSLPDIVTPGLAGMLWRFRHRAAVYVAHLADHPSTRAGHVLTSRMSTCADGMQIMCRLCGDATRRCHLAEGDSPSQNPSFGHLSISPKNYRNTCNGMSGQNWLMCCRQRSSIPALSRPESAGGRHRCAGQSPVRRATPGGSIRPGVGACSGSQGYVVVSYWTSKRAVVLARRQRTGPLRDDSGRGAR